MNTTKKIVSVILAMCMLMSTAVVSSFAAKSGEISPVYPIMQETILTQKHLKILMQSMPTPMMIWVLLTQKKPQLSKYGHQQQPM